MLLGMKGTGYKLKMVGPLAEMGEGEGGWDSDEGYSKWDLAGPHAACLTTVAEVVVGWLIGCLTSPAKC